MADSERNNEVVVDRGKWDRQIEFFLSLLGYTVGIGVLVRYPYLCLANGGAAFIIPYFLAHIFLGIPLYVLELLLGQFSGLSPSTLWNFCPLIKGIGYSMTLLCGALSLSYNMLLAYCIFYLVASFNFQVPWQTCDNWWNTERCWDGNASSVSNFSNSTVEDVSEGNSTNSTSRWVWASDEYWNRRVLGISSEFEEMGSLKLELIGCSAAAWLLIFLCLAWGVKWSGKVVYITATLPFLFLVAFVVRGVTLEGAATGLHFYFIPDFSRLLVPQTWILGSLQMFYSLGPAWGSLITMASYNRFTHNCMREGLIIPLADMGTSIFGGIAVFSILGFMAQQADMSVEEVAVAGPGLSFVTYPLALSKLPGAPVWSMIFFLTLLNLAIDTQFGMFEAVMSGIFDEWPHLRKRSVLVVAISCVIAFFISLIFCTEGGMYYYQLVDWYTAIFTVPFIAFLETIGVCVIYGIANFSEDVKLMLGKPPHFLLKVLWVVAIPLTFLILVIAVYTIEPPKYGEYEYPDYVHYTFLFLLCMSTSLPIPVTAVYVIWKAEAEPYPRGSPGGLFHRNWHKFVSKLKKSCQPNERWHPQDPDAKVLYRKIVENRKKAREEVPTNPLLK